MVARNLLLFPKLLGILGLVGFDSLGKGLSCDEPRSCRYRLGTFECVVLAVIAELALGVKVSAV